MNKNKKESAFFSVDKSIVDWIAALFKLRKIRNFVKFLYFLTTVGAICGGLVAIIIGVELWVNDGWGIGDQYIGVGVLVMLLCPPIFRIIYELVIKWLNRREKRNLRMPEPIVAEHKIFCPRCQRQLRPDSGFCDRCGTKM